MGSEIGGYIELDAYRGQMLYEDGIKLNCGRNALRYLIRAKGIKKLFIPKYMCNSNDAVLKSENVESIYYSIDDSFMPILPDRAPEEWLYIVNYYGQLDNDTIKNFGKNIIVDNAQAYFQGPILGVDTIYTCRKFFGVPDGAILYTDKRLGELPIDESAQRMDFLLGRYERSASEFYSGYVKNNSIFKNEPMKYMSKLTQNLLRGVDYNYTKERRTANFEYLHMRLNGMNRLKLKVTDGPFSYPLYVENGYEIRKFLKNEKIYIPMLWPDVLEICDEQELEYDMAMNILPLPVDQRYGKKEMEIIINRIENYWYSAM